MDNGKTIIQGDDIDRKFVPEPQLNNSPDVEPGENDNSIESKTQTRRLPEIEGATGSSDGEVSRNSDRGHVSRLERWSAMLHGKEITTVADEDAAVAVEAASTIADIDSATGSWSAQGWHSDAVQFVAAYPAELPAGETDPGALATDISPALRTSAATMFGLLAALSGATRQPTRPTGPGSDRDVSPLRAEKEASLERNIFSSSARFRRRTSREF